MTTAIWWIRRDLRIKDNQALAAASGAADRVVPVFVLDPTLLSPARFAEKRVAFLFAGLRELDAELHRLGGALVVRRGQPLEALTRLFRETGATAIFAEEDVTPYARARDERVSGALPLHRTEGLTVHPPEVVRKRDGSAYTVYTPFSRAWKLIPLPSPGAGSGAARSLADMPDVVSEPIPDTPTLPAAVPFVPGEREAVRRLRMFTGPDGAISGYADGRNQLDAAATSGLSPYLRFGMVSARQAVASAVAATQGAADAAGSIAWLNELIWREFYHSILYHFPHVAVSSFRSVYDRIDWRNDESEFAAWCEGRTGYPVVDAAMRQLVEIGWMHNRARMIAASFLVKHLLIDWRWGERFFMRHLVDGDPAANNGGWQWTAGTGTDAAPYFRVFNPVLQGRRYDPDGTFVRRWLPELERVPTRYVHAPWTMPAERQAPDGCGKGIDYPAPIVDHASARERVLEAFSEARRST